MAAILYAEIYLICIIIVAMLLYWTLKNGANSALEQWLRRMLTAFLISFSANLCFTLFNGVRLLPAVLMPASYFFKTVYHIFLCVGVYAWCGYAETERRGTLFERKGTLACTLILLALPVAGAILNLKRHWLFEIDAAGNYVRNFLFQYEMGYLFACTLVFGLRLIAFVGVEPDPNRKQHMKLTSSFSLCILFAWALTFAGESVPVISVVITLELLALFVGTTHQQISLDKLTQVNNRQNLMGFLDYKMDYHDETLFLLMLDVDYFKGINDTYGHLEGDSALIRVASALKKACGAHRKRPYIARYGGDEFIIVLEAVRGEVTELCDGIRQVLDGMNREANTPYWLTVSIGVTQWWPNMTAKDFIAAADEQLYEIKRARRKPGTADAREDGK